VDLISLRPGPRLASLFEKIFFDGVYVKGSAPDSPLVSGPGFGVVMHCPAGLRTLNFIFLFSALCDLPRLFGEQPRSARRHVGLLSKTADFPPSSEAFPKSPRTSFASNQEKTLLDFTPLHAF